MSPLQPTGVTITTNWGHCFEAHPAKVGYNCLNGLCVVCVCVSMCVCVCVYLCVYVCALVVGQALFKYANSAKTIVGRKENLL